MGYLLLDDSDRSTYEPVERLLSTWEKHEFYGPGPYNTMFWSTSIWRKTQTASRSNVVSTPFRQLDGHP